jgi:integrase/recombinase XerD
MTAIEQARYEESYMRHFSALKLQGNPDKTIVSHARAVRRVSSHFDCCTDQLTIEQMEGYFTELVDFYSWSIVKLDRNSLQLLWKYVLKSDWQWVNIINVPQIHTVPDVLTLTELERLILATRQLRYRVFLLTTYSIL